jgi:hypothetical protein
MAANPTYRFDGMKWSTVTLPFAADPVISFVTGNAAGDVWITSTVLSGGFASHLLRGGVWQDFPKPYAFGAIWSLSPDDTWGVGGDGLIDRFRGGTWEQPLWDPTVSRDFVGGAGPDDVWAIGYTGGVTHFTPAGTEVGSIDGATRLNAFYAAAANDLWAVGSAGAVFHGDGRTWQRVNAGVTADLQTVWASGPNDVWIGGGNGTLLRFDGTSWKRPSPALSTSGTIYAIHGWGMNDVWVGGSGGQLSHFTGTAWRGPNMSAVPSTGESFWGIGGSGPTDVWLCGGSTWLYRYDDATNALVRKLLPADSRGTSWAGVSRVSGPAPDNLYLLGIEDAQAIMHWDGTRFTQQEVGARARFSSLWTASNGDVWLAGGPRALRHRAAGP